MKEYQIISTWEVEYSITSLVITVESVIIWILLSLFIVGEETNRC